MLEAILNLVKDRQEKEGHKERQPSIQYNYHIISGRTEILGVDAVQSKNCLDASLALCSAGGVILRLKPEFEIRVPDFTNLGHS